MLRIDLFLFLPAVFLVALGSLVLSSVSPALYPGQFIFLGLAVITFFIFSLLDESILKAFAPFLYFISCGLLLLTLIFGAFTRGTVRWIDIGQFSFQPSEVVKPLLIIFFAWFVARSRQEIRFISAILIFALPLFLILLQPDLGSALVLLGAFLGVIFLGGVPVKMLVPSLIVIVMLIPLLFNFLAPYQKQRIESFLHPADPLGSGYNAIQATIAVGSGEFLGRGLGQGTQAQLLFLPERHTDFIFSSIAEELGFVGTALLIVGIALILYRLVVLIRASETVFAKALLGGIFAAIFVQSSINIGMNLNVLPITGIPLPFVSSGGSALVAMAALLGLASSISSRLRMETRFVYN